MQTTVTPAHDSPQNWVQLVNEQAQMIADQSAELAEQSDVIEKKSLVIEAQQQRIAQLELVANVKVGLDQSADRQVFAKRAGPQCAIAQRLPPVIVVITGEGVHGFVAAAVIDQVDHRIIAHALAAEVNTLGQGEFENTSAMDFSPETDRAWLGYIGRYNFHGVSNELG